VSRPDELHRLSIAEASRGIRDGSLKPTRYVEALIDRALKLNAQLRCTITLAADTALADARAAEKEIGRGAWRGPLHGVPIGIKDCISTAGLLTTANSRVLADWVPAEDAPAVAALRQAGAIVLAKLNLNEFAWSIPSEADLHPPPRNPWSPRHLAMGSSSGSAVAVSSGICPAALGTDAGGSVRQPASNCGLVGLKPSHGLVDSTRALGPPSICEVGPIARTVEDVALVLAALTGNARPHVDPRGQPGRAYRVGVPARLIEQANPEPEVAASFAEAMGLLHRLGMETIEMDIEGLADAAAADFIVLNVEAFAAHEQMLRERIRDYGRSARVYHTQGAFVPAEDYRAAMRVGESVRRRLESALATVDVIATPVTPFVTAEAARASEARPHTGGTAVFTAPFNLTGLPAVAIPCGMSAEGIPIGFQLAGRMGGEADLLAVARAFEQSTSWHAMHPHLELAD
jgi:aspartyl-tRNA(Asn)/glutamyl-tRNA(Gln) amidotransferase subunit A